MKRRLFNIVAGVSLVLCLALMASTIMLTVQIFNSPMWLNARDRLVRRHMPYHAYRLVLPMFLRCGIVEVVLAILPVLWLRKLRLRRRAIAIGGCTQCGYDLRATPRRCPECGTVSLGGIA